MTDEGRAEYRQVRVTFRKSLSDGNYGTESAEVTIEDWVETDTEDIDAEQMEYMMHAANLLSLARDTVHVELLRSPSIVVRDTLKRWLATEKADLANRESDD